MHGWARDAAHRGNQAIVMRESVESIGQTPEDDHQEPDSYRSLDVRTAGRSDRAAGDGVAG